MHDLTDVLEFRKDAQTTGTGVIQRALGVVRRHLDMDIAYVSQFVDNTSVYREIDAPGREAFLKPGDSRPLDEVYCPHILRGRLPELIPDTAELPLAMDMPITTDVPIGAHMSVPIMLQDGQAYGMFCCLSPQANHTLNNRDLEIMKAFADMTAYQIEAEIDASRAMGKRRARIQHMILDRDSFQIVFQPIWDFKQARPVGFECLARFAAEPERTPDQWFNEAAEVDQGPRLEMIAIQTALQTGLSLPGQVYISVNASPATILSPGFETAFDAYPRNRIVLEITEHAPVANYFRLNEILRSLRQKGMRLAVDDVGAGYSSFQHIIELQPDIIKLDMEMTRNIDADPARRALASALIRFAHETGYQILAEGIETAAEMETLQRLGVAQGQGFLLGRPADSAAAHALIEAPSTVREMVRNL